MSYIYTHSTHIITRYIPTFNAKIPVLLLFENDRVMVIPTCLAQVIKAWGK